MSFLTSQIKVDISLLALHAPPSSGAGSLFVILYTHLSFKKEISIALTHLAYTLWMTSNAAMVPSPTAVVICLCFLLRTSPAAYTPFILVSICGFAII